MGSGRHQVAAPRSPSARGWAMANHLRADLPLAAVRRVTGVVAYRHLPIRIDCIVAGFSASRLEPLRIPENVPALGQCLWEVPSRQGSLFWLYLPQSTKRAYAKLPTKTLILEEKL